MAICPVCKAEGNVGAECPNDHHYFVESRELSKAPAHHLLGELVGGQYIPISLIGEGGMGQIYKAKSKYTGMIVALKILKSEFMEDETLKDRFFREAEVVGALDHPNIVKLYGCAPDMEHNTIYIAMELLNGRTLFETLRHGAPRLELILQWFCEMSDALGAAHRKGIFHRDLKPENIFICPAADGSLHAKILDFGFARLQGAAKKLTVAGVAFGTPHYMSPEQAMGQDEITAAVDVYALGVMLFQTITGHLPFDSNKPMDVMYAQVYTPTPEIVPREEYSNVPVELIDVIEKCMEKEPAARFNSGEDLAAALKEVQKIYEQVKNGGGVSRPSEHKLVVNHEDEPSDRVPASDGLPISKTTLIAGSVFILLLLIVVILVLKIF